MNMVSHAGFQAWTHELEPGYHVPHRTTVRARIEGICNTLKIELRKILKKVKFLSITDDGWTSRANDSYMIVTAHWLDENFRVYSCVLSVKEMTNSHTGDELVTVVF